MDHFDGSSASERFNNELMYHARKQTELLEQIAQLLKQDTVIQGAPEKPRSGRKVT